MMLSCRTHAMEDLNTSDHLPLSVNLSFGTCSDAQTEEDSLLKQPSRINWEQARKSGAVYEFSTEVQYRLAPLLNGVYDNAEQLSREIEHVSGMITDAAEHLDLLPHMQPRRRTKWRDDTLSCLCAQSRAARAAWKEAGCNLEGPLFESIAPGCEETGKILCSSGREVADAE